MKFFTFLITLFWLAGGATAAENIASTSNAAAIEQVFTSDINAPSPLPAPEKNKQAKVVTKAAAKTKLKNQAGIKSEMKAANTPIFYSRDTIIIMRKSLSKLPAQKPIEATPATPQQEGAADTPTPAPTPPSIAPELPLAFDTEIRDGMSLYQQNGWFNLSGYSEKTGVMMAFREPDIKPIVKSAQYAQVDILFIDKQGKITQIAPSIMLADLEQDITPSSPILAYLFLKGGTCAALSINVGDEVEYPALFKKPPVILSAPKSDIKNGTTGQQPN